jgi:hypothetical protein
MQQAVGLRRVITQAKPFPLKTEISFVNSKKEKRSERKNNLCLSLTLTKHLNKRTQQRSWAVRVNLCPSVKVMPALSCLLSAVEAIFSFHCFFHAISKQIPPALPYPPPPPPTPIHKFYRRHLKLLSVHEHR